MSGADSKKKAFKSKTERKQGFFLKFSRLLEEYPKIVIANGDNVGSNQFQKIRIELRGKGIIVMGKKTIMRKVIRGMSAAGKTQFDGLLPYVKGNVAFIFTKGDLHEIKKVADANKVQSPARSGSLAPNDVMVPAGNTGMEPTKTSFFQALSIPTKITKGQVEIISDVKLIKAGAKVDTSQATLLQMLNIKPFKYGLIVSTVYDEGSIYEAKVLDITPEDILQKFHRGVQNIASISLATGIPTLASVPHSIINGYKNVLSIALAVDFTFPALDDLKKKLASAPAPAAAAAAPAAAAKDAPKKEEKKKEEPKEEEDADMGLDLFG